MRISKKQILNFTFLIFFILFALVAYLPVRADSSLLNSQTGISEIGNVYGNSHVDIRITIAKIINVVLSFLGIIFIVLVIFAGFQYMMAAGNEEKAKEALSLMRNAVIGLLIILMAWVITRYSIYVLHRTINNALDYTWYPSFR